MEGVDLESHRLSVLYAYNILDTAAEKAYDDFTRLAAAVCNAPIALVSFVDQKRQWFKARTGLTVAETPREHSFCAHAICTKEMMVVPDATKDDRFRDNPLVTDSPQIRFYAAAPLVVNGGWNLGTLCVIDHEPRELAPAQVKALEVIRNCVVTQLEHRRAVEEVKALESLLPMCVWCRKIKSESQFGDAWVPIHEYIAQFGPLEDSLCPSCRDQVSLVGR